MRPWPPSVRLLCVLALAWTAVAEPQTEARSGPPLARLSYVEPSVEQGTAKAMRPAAEDSPLRLGDTLRTGKDGMARIEFAWMALTLSPASAVTFPDELVLSARLAEGRVALSTGRREILKLVTAEAEVRGRGYALVRREPGATLVTCVEGRFVVDAAGRAVTVDKGRGTIVRAGQPPGSPVALPVAPTDLWPGTDPIYVAVNEPIELKWQGGLGSYSLEVLPIGRDVLLVQRDVAEAKLSLSLPWSGAFRWRVAARDARGLEGLPSSEGQIVVDD